MKRYGEISDHELCHATSGQVEARFEDGIKVSYCPDTYSDGPIASVDDNDIGVWVCATCGRMTDRCTNDSQGRWSLAAPSDEFEKAGWVTIRGRIVLEDIIPPVSVVDSPYAAKNDIKQLPFRATERQWVDDLNSWVVATDAEQRFVEHMRAYGWPTVNVAQVVFDGDSK